MAAGLALAACSKTQPSSPAPGAAPGAAPLGPPAAPAAPAADASPAAKKGSHMTADDEAVITKHYEQQGWGKPLEIIAYEHVPGMYKAVFADGADYGVVRGGKILEGKGLAAAGAYMRDAKLLAQQPDAGDLTMLLSIFEALPPVSGYASPDQFYDHATKHTQLNPKLELGAGGGKLVLHYLLPRRGGPTAQPDLATAMRWTLTIPKDYKLAWREEGTKLDTSAP